MAIAKTITLELQKMPAWAKNILIVAASSIVLGLSAHLAIPLPFTPVPIAIQGIAVLLLSLLLGPKRAIASVAAFLMQGALGFPVFANGAGGIHILMGPTGGYLIGYLFASIAVSYLSDRLQSKTLASAAAMLLIGEFIIFASGAAWLATFVGVKQSFTLGVLPFLPGDALKILAALKLLQWLKWNRAPLSVES